MVDLEEIQGLAPVKLNDFMSTQRTRWTISLFPDDKLEVVNALRSRLVVKNNTTEQVTLHIDRPSVVRTPEAQQAFHEGYALALSAARNIIASSMTDAEKRARMDELRASLKEKGM